MLFSEAEKNPLQQADRATTTIAISFFFNARGALLERSPLGFYRSILHQLFRQVPQIDPDIMKDFRSKKEYICGWAWSEGELHEMVQKTLHLSSRYKYRLYVDALDECGERSARTVIDFFNELLDFAGTARCDLRLCVSSRSYPNLQIRSCSKVFMEEFNAADITRVLSRRLQALGKDSYQLVRQITNKCLGIFLWAILVLENFREAIDNGETPDALSRTLSTIPDSLETMFQGIIDPIPLSERQMFTFLIFWVLFAQRPLTLHELRLALAFQDPFPMSLICHASVAYVANEEDMEKLCRKWSRGLVEVTRPGKAGSAIVQFIHESAREFLLDPDRLHCLNPELAGNVRGPANDQLARSCLNYLRIGSYDSLSSRTGLDINFGHYIVAHFGNYQHSNSSLSKEWSNSGFLEYACKYAFKHAAEAEKHGTSQLHIVEEFHDQPGLISSVRLPRSSGPGRFRTHCLLNEFSADGDILHQASQHNLTSVVARIQARCDRLAEKTVQEAFIAAMAAGNKAMGDRLGSERRQLQDARCF